MTLPRRRPLCHCEEPCDEDGKAYDPASVCHCEEPRDEDGKAYEPASICHCEEPSDEAISKAYRSPTRAEIAALRKK